MVSEDRTRNSVNERTDRTEHAGSGSTPSLHPLLVHHSKSLCGRTAFRSILVSPKEPAREAANAVSCRLNQRFRFMHWGFDSQTEASMNLS